MSKSFFTYMFFGLLMCVGGLSQSSMQSTNSAYSYYPPSKDKESWQRLYLLLSSTFLNVAKEGQVDLDSCLFTASRSLGLSRISILAEGINDPGLLEHSQWIDRQDPASGIRLLSDVTGKRHLQLLLLLGSYYAFQTDSYHRHLDSVKLFLSKAIIQSKLLKEDRLGRQALCLLGKVYVQGNDNKGDSIYNLLINECKAANDKETEARTLVYRSRYTPPMLATLQKKMSDSQQAGDIYHSLGNTEGEINALTDVGYLLTVTRQLQPAKEVFLRALKLAESIHFPYTHYNAQTLSMITFFQGKFGEPLLYTRQMIKVAESCRDSIGWAYFYSTLSVMLTSEGRTQESLEVTQKAIKRFIIERNPTVFNLLVDIIVDMGENGRAKEALDLVLDISQKVNTPTTIADQFGYHHAFSICYLNLKQLDLAEMHAKKMNSLETTAEAVRGPLRRSKVNNQFAQIFILKGQYLKARKLYEEYFTDSSVVMHSLTENLYTYRWLIIIDSVLGDNASGIAHYKKYTQLLDSNFKVTKIRQAEELDVMYQTREKETQIASLTQEAKLEKANSDKAILVKNLAFVGIAAVVTIAGLLYRQNRLKQKSNQMITRKNDQLEDLLADKEWLLKEIHHRVKNNLQIVMSLLNSQSLYINNDAALAAIHDSERRVHAMALIHQKLYQSENISTIAMREYINELVNYVQDSFDIGNRIIFEQTVEALYLDVSQAIPLGLIINESIVNAIKYAFPGKRKGVVSIHLHHDDSDHLLLEISDNGIGLPSELDISKLNSIGIDLMQGLTKQLKGSFTIDSNKGLHISVRFIVLSKQFSDESLVNYK